MSGSDDIHKRLEGLNRGPLPPPDKVKADLAGVRKKLRKAAGDQPPAPRKAIVYERHLPRHEPPERRRWRPAPDRHVTLEEAVDAVELSAPQGGSTLLIVDPLTELGQPWQGVCRDFGRRLRDASSSLGRRIEASCGLSGLEPEDAIFMDLETTGLASTPLFLIGAMVWEDGALAVRQYLARDYSQESATISAFLESMAGRRLLVTFNGKSFDLPYLRVRAAATGVACAVEPAHFDLLHECRRAWRHVLPDCRLQTLEHRICDRLRESDIPGEEIPAAYHDFVRTGNAVEIVQIVRHNMLDLVTLAELAVRLPPP